MQVTEHLTKPEASLLENWAAIRKHFFRCIKLNGCVSIASVRPDGQPTISPIGSFYLCKEAGKGYYFELFSTAVARNRRSNPQVCVMGADAGKWFWLKSLYKGKFSRNPAIKLYGRAGELRDATDEEVNGFLKLVRPLRWTKGHDMLWGTLSKVREIEFHSFEEANLGKMTR